MGRANSRDIHRQGVPKYKWQSQEKETEVKTAQTEFQKSVEQITQGIRRSAVDEITSLQDGSVSISRTIPIVASAKTEMMEQLESLLAVSGLGSEVDMEVSVVGSYWPNQGRIVVILSPKTGEENAS